MRRAGVGAELALAREPGDDEAGQKAQHDVEHDGGDQVAYAGAGAVVALAQGAVDEVADDAAQEHNEGVHDTLDQCHRDHVAVGHVGHLMAQHAFDFLARHALQQTGGHRYKCRVLEGAGGEGIGLALVDRHLGHGDAGLVGQAAHGLDDPGLIGILRRSDDAGPGTPLGHGLADQQ